jgi:hypothetical protein
MSAFDSQLPPGSVHLDEDRCLDLLHGLLEGPEAEAIVAHVAACAACESLLRGRAGERERIRAQSTAYRPTLVVGTNGATPRDSGAPIRKIHASEWRVLVPWAIAASILLIAGRGTLRFFGNSHGNSAAQIAPAWIAVPHDGVANRDARSDSADALVDRGLAAYETHDFETAVRLLAAAKPDGEMDLVRVVFLASALTWKGDTESVATAERLLASVPIDDLPDPWRSEALWTRCVVLRHQNKGAEASTLLKALSSRTDAIGERARKALDAR